MSRTSRVEDHPQADTAIGQADFGRQLNTILAWTAVACEGVSGWGRQQTAEVLSGAAFPLAGLIRSIGFGRGPERTLDDIVQFMVDEAAQEGQTFSQADVLAMIRTRLADTQSD